MDNDTTLTPSDLELLDESRDAAKRYASESIVYDMPINSIGWVTPWSIEKTDEGAYMINLCSSYCQRERGTASTRIRRNPDGFEFDRFSLNDNDTHLYVGLHALFEIILSG